MSSGLQPTKLSLAFFGSVFVVGSLIGCKTRAEAGRASEGASPSRSAETARNGVVRAESYELDGGAYAASVFVPDRKGARPVVLLFDPAGKTERAVRTWAPGAEEYGWIAASPSVVKNGTPDEHDARHMLSLLEALKTRYTVDSEQVYTAGVSGGGCGAYVLAITRPAVFAGAFVQVAHAGAWRSAELSTRITRHDQRFHLFTRDGDFNRTKMYELATAMQSAGLQTLLVELPGGHQGMTETEVSSALAWMSGR